MNQLKGKVMRIQSSDYMSLIEVDVGGDVFSSIVLEGSKTPVAYKVNDDVTLVFKETEVGIAKHMTGMISLRNRFKATIDNIDQGPILAKVTLNYRNHRIEAIISTQATKDMYLTEKEDVEWLVKSNEVTLMKTSL